MEKLEALGKIKAHLYGKVWLSSMIALLLASGILTSLVVRADGLYSANGVLGKPSFTATDFSGATLNGPEGTALDGVHHRLFVADEFNARVLVFNLDANNHLTSRTADFVLGETTSQHSAPACFYSAITAAGLCSPTDLAVDSSGNRLFVVDNSNNRIVEYDLSGGVANGMSAVHVLGQPDFTSGGGGLAADRLNNPRNLAVDSTDHRLFISDTGNARILEFDLTAGDDPIDGTADHVLGQPDFTSNTLGSTTASNGRFSALAFDDANNKLFAADAAANRVLLFDTTTLTDNQAAAAVLGQPDFTSHAAGTSQTSFNSPAGISLAANTHQLFVADNGNSRILEFGLDANDSPASGAADHVLGQLNFTTATASTTQNGLNSPNGVAVSSDGQSMYVGDTANNRVLVFDLSQGISNGMNATDVLGQFDDNNNPLFTTSDFNNQRPTQARLEEPVSTALDASGHRLFVGDQNRIMIYNLDANNNITTRFAAHVLGEPNFNTRSGGTTASTVACTSVCSLAYDSSRQLLFVGDLNNNRILVFNADPGTMTDGEAASYVFGAPDFTTVGPCAATAKDFCPEGSILYDSATKRLFVGDAIGNTSSGRILIFDTTTLANYPSAIHVLGQPDFTSMQAGVDAQHFVVDASGMEYNAVTGQLYVSDSDNNRLLVFNADPGTMTDGEAAEHVLGQPDFTSSNSTTTQNGFNFPEGVLLDTDHQLLFVADVGASRIMVFDAHTITDGQNAIGVLGQPDFTSSVTTTSPNATTLGLLNSLMGDSYDPGSRSFYYPDQGNNRVLRFSFVKLATASLPNGDLHTSYTAPLATTNAQGTKMFTVSAGSLPAGLTLDAATGEITGIPTTAGTYPFTLTVADDNGNAGTYADTRDYTITIPEPGGPGNGVSSLTTQSVTSDNSSSGNTETTTPSQTPSESTQAVSGTIPILNMLPHFFSGGAKVSFSVGGSVHFCLNGKSCADQELHAITLKSIDVLDQTAVFTFASKPQNITFAVGQTKKVDVNQDGKPDIQATLNGLTRDSADLTLSPAPSTVAAAKTRPSSHTAWLVIGVVVVTIGFIIYRLKRHQHHAANEVSQGFH